MGKSLRVPALCFALFLGTTSCNIYAPFQGDSGSNGILEAALKCLHENNIECAIEKYQGLSSGDLKNRKLCSAYLTQAGLTLSTMLNTITGSSTSLIGNLATAFMPHTSAKETAAGNAVTECDNYLSGASSSDTDFAAYLHMVARLVNCAVRMTRADQFVTDAADDDCDTVSPNTAGTLSNTDIASNVTGAVGAGDTGLCQPDVLQCYNNIRTLNDTAVGTAGFTDIASAINTIQALLPANLSNAAEYAQVRAALRATVP